MPVDAVDVITHHQLRVFAAVAGEGSFARAARRLFTSEPTVSNHIRALERAVGATLIERSRGRRQTELTPAGRVLLRTCHTIFQSLEQGVEAARALDTSAKHTIAVGAGPHFGGFVLPHIIESFHASHPNVAVRVEVGRNQPLLVDLKRGRLDLALVYGPIDDDEIIWEPFFSADIGIVAPVGHPLTHRGHISLETLVEQPLIVAEASSPPRMAIEAYARERGLALRIAMEAQDTYARIQAVMNGLGLAPMYLDAVSSAVAAGQLAILNVEGFPQRMERLIVSRADGLSPDATVFRSHLMALRDERTPAPSDSSGSTPAIAPGA